MLATVADFKEKIKSLGIQVFKNRDLFPAVVVLLVGVTSFGLGRLSVELPSSVDSRHLVSVSQPAQAVGNETILEPVHTDARASWTSDSAVASGAVRSTTAGTLSNSQKKYVGSKNGTKYYLPSCGGVRHIAEGNKVWFGSKEEATAAGYTPAANCKGI